MFDEQVVTADSTETADAVRRQQLLADLRRRITTVAPGADKVGAPLRLDVPAAPAPVSPALVEALRPSAGGIVAVPAPLAEILPRGGLPKGGVVSLAGGRGTTSLLLTLLAEPTGLWSALVGMPGIGLLAAAELGVDLDRLVVVPDPGPDVLQVLSVLVDGVDLVAVVPPRGGFTAPARLRVLTGRLRQRGAVLLVAGGWPGADLVLRARVGGWSGIGQGHGRLRDRELTVEVRGRGTAGLRRSATMVLHSNRTGVRVLPGQARPVAVPVTPIAEVS